MIKSRARRKLPRTEERVFPAARRIEDGMLAEHWARYRFIAPRLSGRILDLGCGTGYGARHLASIPDVTEIVAVDSSGSALEIARRYYPDPKISYRKANLLHRRWESDLGSFDFVVAFEILEHLSDETIFWKGVDCSLAEDGLLWLSTPLGRGRGRPAADRFHVHQLRRSEVEQLFDRSWEKKLYGQTGCLIEPWVAGRHYYTILVCAHRSGRE